MPETRTSLIKEWAAFTSPRTGLSLTDDNEEFQSSRSPALIFLERLIAGLRMSVIEGVRTSGYGEKTSNCGERKNSCMRSSEDSIRNRNSYAKRMTG